MPRTRPPYPEEFRRQMVELVRTGRTPEELASLAFGKRCREEDVRLSLESVGDAYATTRSVKASSPRWSPS